MLAEDETDLLLFPPLRAAWCRRGEAAAVWLSGRNARRVIFGAMNLRTGSRLLLPRPKGRSSDFQALLEKSEQEVSQQRWSRAAAFAAAARVQDDTAEARWRAAQRGPAQIDPAWRVYAEMRLSWSGSPATAPAFCRVARFTGVSGSMHGFPLETAKVLMRNLLGKLRPSDYFNVVLFSGAAHVRSPRGSIPACSRK